ncbi:MAG TPA: tannase/feruloyl esterase family alpha/beta hydrolase, partial [Bryobacteraceae bacterium]
WDKEPDETSNMLLALERWVESGVAPSHLTAVRYKQNRPASGIERTRPICPYPQVAKYKGSGSTDDAASFECKVP